MKARPDYDTWMYHQLHNPSGKIFKSSEVPDLLRRGWVDTPAKFGRGVRGYYYSCQSYLQAWSKMEIFAAIAVVVSIVALFK